MLVPSSWQLPPGQQNFFARCGEPSSVRSRTQGVTAQRPGAETHLDAMWSPALARGLIRDDVLRLMAYRDGYTDLLGPDAPAPRGLAQRAMQSPRVAEIHERIWRPFMDAVMRLHGESKFGERSGERSGEREKTLHLGGEQRVLDVACGPGNFTSFFAGQLCGEGFAIGLDDSVPMMERAVRDNGHDRAVYMRADPVSLPFNERTFDVVCCIAALHFLPEPTSALHEMVRVLSPDGQIAVMTTYGRESPVARQTLELGACVCGVRVFDRTFIPAFFAAAGLVDIHQQVRGISQFVVARRPDRITELDRWRTRSIGWRLGR
jgi:ubiquinone/menaquinone biosynthesis C-methylase UbiE